MNSVSGNRFDPQAGATRAQAATILRNYLSKDQNDQTTDTGKDSKAVVEIIADELNVNLFEITLVTPYASADLNWNTEGSRVNREHENEALCDISLTKTTPANCSGRWQTAAFDRASAILLRRVGQYSPQLGRWAWDRCVIRQSVCYARA